MYIYIYSPRPYSYIERGIYIAAAAARPESMKISDEGLSE